MLFKNSDVICANFLTILVKRNLISFVEASKPPGAAGEGAQQSAGSQTNDNIDYCST